MGGDYDCLSPFYFRHDTGRASSSEDREVWPPIMKIQECGVVPICQSFDSLLGPLSNQEPQARLALRGEIDICQSFFHNLSVEKKIVVFHFPILFIFYIHPLIYIILSNNNKTHLSFSHKPLTPTSLKSQD